MKWIHRLEQEPDPEKYKWILVNTSSCHSPSVNFYDDGKWVNDEWMSFKFDLWMPIPELSKEQNAVD